MIKYPLYVTLDTNIFDANKLDFSQDSTLGLLINHVKAGKIKIVLSNIVLKEVEKHIIKASDGVCSSFRGLRKDLINGVSDKFLEEIGIKTDLLMLNKEEYRTKSLEMWKKFLKKLNPEILNLSLVDLDGIVSDYFAINPPFESSEKKRKEFPDAFIANQIRKRFCENEVIAIISDDKGLKKACGYSENHIFYQSLGELYNAINRQEREYKEIVRIINSLIGRYFSEIEEKIKNEDCLEVHGLSCDSDGIESGYDYSDAEVVSIRGISSRVRSIDEITDETAWATLLCTASIDVVCSYEDYDNAVWDSETRSYYCLETRKNLEKHMARFGVRIELDRKENNLKIVPFKVILNSDTIHDCFEIDEDEEEYDEMDIINQERDLYGLCSLDKYEDYLNEELIDSSFMNDIVAKFEKINDLYQEYEDIACIYDEFLSIIRDTEKSYSIKQLVLGMKDIKGFPVSTDTNNITSDEKEEIDSWADQSYERLYKLSEQQRLPDNFEYGDTIEIHNGMETYQFNIGEFSGAVEAGDQEDIPLSIEDGEGNVISKGHVILTVGYMDFDEDGGAGDGIEDEVEYYYENILNTLEDIAELIEQDVKREKSITDKIEKYSKNKRVQKS